MQHSPQDTPVRKQRRLAAIAARSGALIRKIDAAPRWVWWLKAALLVLAMLVGVFYLLPRIEPLALSRELVVGIRLSPVSLTRENTVDEHGKAIIRQAGFDHDLVAAFARSLGKRARFVVAPDDMALHQMLERGEVHMAAAWLTQSFIDAPSSRGQTGADDEQTAPQSLLLASQPYARDAPVLVQSVDSKPLTRLADLHEQPLHVLSTLRYANWLAALAEQKIEPKPQSHADWTEDDLLQAVADDHDTRLAVVPNIVFRIALNYTPGIDSTLTLGPEEDIVWAFPKNRGAALVQKANRFLARAEKDGTLRQLRDRYFGALERLQTEDRSGFLARLDSRLPQYLAQFKAAQTATGYDWRLLAALAYQESQWENQAVSKTGVRGLMMLTADTATQLGIKDRLDPYQSIVAGARYLSQLRADIPVSVPEPDRLWMAIASYNVGPGQIQAARTLAKGMQLNPDTWVDVKRTLPLLGATKDGIKIRGGEAVVTAENVRMYYAILSRRYSASAPFTLNTPTRTYGISVPPGRVGF